MSAEAKQSGRVLIVDDEEFIRDLVATYLKSRGYECESASDGVSALQLASTGCFDVMLSDVHMPGMDGMRLIRKLQQTSPDIPVILVTAQSSFDTAVQALQLGAYDYIVKPFPLEALDAAVARAMQTRRLQRENENYQRLLTQKVEQKTAQILTTGRVVERQQEELRDAFERMQVTFDKTVTALVNAIEMRDTEASHHCHRGRAYTQLLAETIGLPPEQVRDFGWGALLHDVGKLGVPDSILLKSGPLDAQEWSVMKRHPITGHDMLRGIEFLEGAAQVVIAHHEKWDGSGYPFGKSREDIPLGARCFAIADAYEMLTSHGAQGRALTVDEARRRIVERGGRDFDPDLVQAFVSIPASDLAQVQIRFPETPREAPYAATARRSVPQARPSQTIPLDAAKLAAEMARLMPED